MKLKKMAALCMVSALTVGLLAGCSSNNVAADTTGAVTEEASTEESSQEAVSELAGTKITFLNSKGEIQEAMEKTAEAFTQETGIELEILACGTGELPAPITQALHLRWLC